MPLLSIIVTVYNIEQYIEQCLLSILTQEFTDYELIVVDNGSVDNSVKICEKYQSIYPNRMKFISLPSPTEIGRAYTKAISLVKGQYIQNVDGDDYLSRGCLIEIAKLIKRENPDLVFGSFVADVEPNAISIRDAGFDGQLINHSSYDDVLNYLSTLPNFHPVNWRYIYKRGLVKKRKNKFIKPDERFQVSTNDWVGSTKFILESKKISYFDGPFYNYRRRSYGAQTNKDRTNISNYFITLIFLLRSTRNEYLVGSRFLFIISRIKLLLENFTSGIDLVTYKDLCFIAELIDDYKDVFEILKDCKNAVIEELYLFLKTHGSLEGLMLFCEYIKISFLESMPNIADQEIYVFPTGIKGEATGRLLKNQGLKVKGFLDNDSNKQNKTIEGVLCSDPLIMKFLSKEQRNNTYIVIATLYEYLNDVLINQLLDMGISMDHIIIRR